MLISGRKTMQAEEQQVQKHALHFQGIQVCVASCYAKVSADKWIRKLWYIYTMKYYSAIKNNSFESVLMRWMKLEPIIQSEVSQKEKHQ